MERAAWLTRRFGAVVEWLPFDLHPEYPSEGIRRADLEARYGPEALARTRRMIEEAGLEYAPPDVVPNSLHALALAEFARGESRHEDIHDRLFRAYWAEGRDIGDTDVLLEIAGDAGLDSEKAVLSLDDDGLKERIRKSTETAIDAGAGGVPAWVLDQRFLVPGAQPHEVFEGALRRLGHSPTEE